MDKDELFRKYNETLSKGKEEMEKWILSLSDEEFEEFVQIPIIVQAKIHYKKLREDNQK